MPNFQVPDLLEVKSKYCSKCQITYNKEDDHVCKNTSPPVPHFDIHKPKETIRESTPLLAPEWHTTHVDPTTGKITKKQSDYHEIYDEMPPPYRDYLTTRKPYLSSAAVPNYARQLYATCSSIMHMPLNKFKKDKKWNYYGSA